MCGRAPTPWPISIEVRQKCRQVSVQRGLGGIACAHCRRWRRGSWALSCPVGREKERANQSRVFPALPPGLAEVPSWRGLLLTVSDLALNRIFQDLSSRRERLQSPCGKHPSWVGGTFVNAGREPICFSILSGGPHSLPWRNPLLQRPRV